MDCLKWLLANLYAVGPAGYQIRGVLMDASWPMTFYVGLLDAVRPISLSAHAEYE